MNSQTTSTIVVQRLLDQLKSGDPKASQQLLDVSLDRLRALTQKILAGYPAVKRWEETDDVLQNSSVRLWRALENHQPPTPLDYFRLAAAVIRRELIDISRRHFGPLGIGTNQAKSWIQTGSNNESPIDQLSCGTNDPVDLGCWSEFHSRIENLPDEEQLLFDLLWYQGLSIGEAAEVAGFSERTLRRRWRAARIALHRELTGDDLLPKKDNP